MAEAFIYDAVRSPRGKARADGGLAGLTPPGLVTGLAGALAGRAGDTARNPGALLLGCVTQAGAGRAYRHGGQATRRLA